MDKSIRLTTDRLLLRAFTANDAEEVFEYATHPEMARYGVYTLLPPYKIEDFKALVTMFSDPPPSQGMLQFFAVVLDGKVIGEIGLNQHQEDLENDRAELVYSISYHHWNKGLTTEGAEAVIDWAFRTHPLKRIYAWSDPRNTGSWRIMEKLGMKREGILRSHTKWQGIFRDRVYYGLLREEWETK